MCTYILIYAMKYLPNISNIIIKPLLESKYVKPVTVTYLQNGKQIKYDLLSIFDSVAILLFNTSRNVLVFVKQFRPAVYASHIPPEYWGVPINIQKFPLKLGITVELCAGIVDKNKSLEQIAVEEIKEECGYDVPCDSLKKISSFNCLAFHLKSTQHLYYCEVTDDVKKWRGGGVQREVIEITEMTVPQVQEYLKNEVISSPPTLLYAVAWFLNNKQNGTRT